jgi:hypothetical protein
MVWELSLAIATVLLTLAGIYYRKFNAWVFEGPLSSLKRRADTCTVAYIILITVCWLFIVSLFHVLTGG